MKNKQNKKRVCVLTLLGLLALGGAFVSGTYAKYTHSASGSDSATVAKWDIKVNDEDMSDTITIDNLFSTAYDTTVSSTKKVVAPGTTGSFSFKVTNASEVAAKYSLTITETNAGGIPIEYKIGDGAWQKTTAGTLTLATDEALAIGASDTVTVSWQWAFEGSGSTNYKTEQTDTKDTELGTAGSATVTLKATLTAEQVD